MKKITQAFMQVLMSMNVQEKNIKAIVQMFWEKPHKMDELVAFIKENPKASESEILKKATEISE